MNKGFTDKDVNVIKANRLLQAKVGSGNIDETRILQSQAVIESDQTDFAPLAREFLDRLETALAQMPPEADDIRKIIQPIIIEIMQIKANAAMFHYNLSSTLANIILDFLENLKSWDKDAYDIVATHLKTQRLIINNGLKGHGGDYGAQLTTELREACNRYYNKKSDAAASSGVFFVDF